MERKLPATRAGEARASFAKGEVPGPADRVAPDRPASDVGADRLARDDRAPRDAPDRLSRDVPDRQPRDVPDRQPRSLPAQPDRPREAPGRETESEMEVSC